MITLETPYELHWRIHIDYIGAHTDYIGFILITLDPIMITLETP